MQLIEAEEKAGAMEAAQLRLKELQVIAAQMPRLQTEVLSHCDFVLHSAAVCTCVLHSAAVSPCVWYSLARLKRR